VRLIHTSDWHLGRGLHGADLLEHQGAFLGWLRAQAVEHEVDVVVVAGDVYDRAVPSTDAVQLLNETLVGFARDGIPLVLISGNHDSAVRLGFGSGLVEAAGIHVRTRVSDVARPVLIADEHGEVAVYGLPYLLPDAVMEELGAERSHQSVVAAALRRVREDAAARGIARTVVVAHAFVAGGAACDSERDLRVGGIGDVPAAVFDGVTYVALGHLHGPQTVAIEGSATTVRYSGSPLAFSFSEKNHAKAVTLVELDATGVVRAEQLPAPVPRPLREVRGCLDDLLARAATDLAGLADAWVKVVLTDRSRPASPMERLREKWPYTLVLDFAPEGGLVDSDTDLRRLAATVDPVEICGLFVEFVDAGPPDDAQRLVLRDVVETVQHAEVGA
jgi:exonuclease SbcD